jgi:sulfatase modifying factor 1
MNAPRLPLSLAAVLLLATPGFSQLVNYELVPVGNPGNAPDTTGYGAVPYEYQIGKYEVTIGQYAAFLNAVAKTDTYGLYGSRAGNLNSPEWAGIDRIGEPGNYSYVAIGPVGQPLGQSTLSRPYVMFDWYSATRFINWMSNGQPTGSQNNSTTEDGAYFLNGVTDGVAIPRNLINPNTGAPPSFWMPDVNEWYKAAYFGPGNGTGAYTKYATQSNVLPSNVVSSDDVNGANFRLINVYSLTQLATTEQNQNYVTDVGSFGSSPSFYGTFDQTGNAVEMMRVSNLSFDTTYVLRGGSWNTNVFPGGDLPLTKEWEVGRFVAWQNTGDDLFKASGLRLAAVVPEPSTCMMALAGLACGGYTMYRRRKRA